jgi:hypothetical protein
MPALWFGLAAFLFIMLPEMIGEHDIPLWMMALAMPALWPPACTRSTTNGDA